jgi:hypothetical protein
VIEKQGEAHSELLRVFGIALIEENACMKNRVAWSPLKHPDTILIVGVLCPPGQIMCRDIYNYFLGRRMQTLVEVAEDTEHATWTFKEALHDAGMWGYDDHGPVNEIGNNLVVNNPCVWEALTNLRVYDSVWPPRKVPTSDSLIVRRELQGEWSHCDDPEG